MMDEICHHNKTVLMVVAGSFDWSTWRQNRIFLKIELLSLSI